MTALFDLVEKHPIDPAQVKKLRIALSKPVFDMHGIFASVQGASSRRCCRRTTSPPRSCTTARMTLAQFEPARYDDAKLRRFAEQVEVQAPIPRSAASQARVEIEMADGKTLSARCEHPRGSPENRLSRAQIEAKFRTYARGRLSDAQVEDVIAAVVRLEALPSARTLMDSLRARRQAGAAGGRGAGVNS